MTFVLYSVFTFYVCCLATYECILIRDGSVSLDELELFLWPPRPSAVRVSERASESAEDILYIVYIYMYIYICGYICVWIYICIYIYVCVYMDRLLFLDNYSTLIYHNSFSLFCDRCRTFEREARTTPSS